MSAGAAPVGRRRGARLRYELMLGLELAALTSLLFARPVLDSFGRSPETFIARGVGPREIVAFGVLVLVLPAVVAAVAGLAAALLGRTTRRLVHLLLVAGLSGGVAWRIGQDLTGWSGATRRLIAGGVVVGVAVGILRWVASSPVRTFLRWAGAASVVFLVQFLFLSPVSSLVRGDSLAVDEEVARSVAADLGEDPPDVVVLLFDALPTATLLDGAGHIDAELYPNFARLADTGTWYRNHTTVSAFTAQAVPAILTGRYPEPGEPGFPSQDPENLFTLLGGSYRVTGREVVTRLCPDELCPRQAAGVRDLLGDAIDLWTRGAVREAEEQSAFHLPSGLGTDRYESIVTWIDAHPPGARQGGPELWFHHVMLPHDPWVFTDDGTVYAASHPPTGSFSLGWTDVGVDVARQRHVLQTQLADRILGRVLDDLEANDTLDDTLVVVTADHGFSLTPWEAVRSLSAGNPHEIAWTPLLVKAPDQRAGVVVDEDVRSVDVLPTIADILGIDLPWDVEGIPARRVAAERDEATKPIAPHPLHQIDPPEDRSFVELDTREGFERLLASDQVEGRGPDAVWKRTAYGELLHRAVADLETGPPGGRVEVEELGGLDAVRLDDPLPLEVVGWTGLDGGTVVAYALNGVVAALAEVRGDPPLALALLHPDRLRAGDNELTAYAVRGPVDDPVLHPLEVTERE